MLVTVATPTYNRAHLLSRLYTSLCCQEFKDFEWLVIDDGSSDDTEKVIQGFVKENFVKIRYIHKNNGGKHTAVNLAAKEAKGDLFFIADSDDWLPVGALKSVAEIYSGIKFNERFAGICGLDINHKGELIGSRLPADIIDATYIDIRNKFKITGDMKEVYLTSVMREFPFPEIEGEKFCSEALIWNRIASKYMLRFSNTPLYCVEYMNDGLTSSITRTRMNSPIATMMTYSEWVVYDIPLLWKCKMAINYWRFAFCAKKRVIKIAKWTYPFAFLGWLMHIKDKLTIKR